MAVKVMVAPAIANGEIEKSVRRPRAADPAPAPAKARRRRSSVYDADGNEVFITLMCLKCHKMRPLSQFGLRRMSDGAIRNQPWCRTCRSGATEQPKRRGSVKPAEDVEAAETAGSPAAAAPDAQSQRAPATLAAEVAAALAGGFRR